MAYCAACDRYFNSNEALIQHTEAKHGRGNVHRGVRTWEDSRNQCGELTTGSAAGSYQYDVGYEDYDSDSEMWNCSFCFQKFHRKHDLEQHLNSGKHEQDLYRCQGCSRTFRNLGALNQHVSATECSARSARQVRTLLADANRHQQGLLQLTDQSRTTCQAAAPEGVLFFDGGASPNPGCGGAGYRLLDDRGNEVGCRAISIYPYTGVTNNQAEYIALIQGMRHAKEEGMKRLVAKGDSEIVVNQMTGAYNCFSDKLVPLNNFANEIERYFTSVTYTHIPRNQNTVADGLANQGRTQEYDYEVMLDLDLDPPVRRA